MNTNTTTLKHISIIADKLNDGAVLSDVLVNKGILTSIPASVTYNSIVVNDVINNNTLRVSLDVALDDQHLTCSVLVSHKEPYTFDSYYEFINVVLV